MTIPIWIIVCILLAGILIFLLLVTLIQGFGTVLKGFLDSLSGK